MSVRPIETVYRGYRFRSRLEARWAVFFDALGIRWEYEPEGYQLDDGTKYLPDFFLPEFEGGCWVEVKPRWGDWRKAAAFSFGTGQPMWLAHGLPGTEGYYLLRGRDPRAPDRNFLDPRQDPDGDMELHIYFDLLTGCVPLASEANGENRMYWHADIEATAHDWTFTEWVDEIAPHVARARDAARAARFEFGENGPPAPAKRQRARPTTREVAAQLARQTAAPIATFNAPAKPRRRGKRPTFTSAEIVALLAGDPLPGRATDTE